MRHLTPLPASHEMPLSRCAWTRFSNVTANLHIAAALHKLIAAAVGQLPAAQVTL